MGWEGQVVRKSRHRETLLVEAVREGRDHRTVLRCRRFDGATAAVYADEVSVVREQGILRRWREREIPR